MAESVRVSAVKRVLKISDTKIYSECVNQRGLRGEAGGGGEGGRDWERRGLEPRNNVLTTCKAVTLPGSQRVIAVFFPQ